MEDDKDEVIYELREENKRLRGQITYLQEELASVEDELDKCKAINAALEYPPDPC